MEKERLKASEEEGAFDELCSLWVASSACCGNYVSGVRFLDQILREIRERGSMLQSRGKNEMIVQNLDHKSVGAQAFVEGGIRLFCFVFDDFNIYDLQAVAAEFLLYNYLTNPLKFKLWLIFINNFQLFLNLKVPRGFFNFFSGVSVTSSRKKKLFRFSQMNKCQHWQRPRPPHSTMPILNQRFQDKTTANAAKYSCIRFRFKLK